MQDTGSRRREGRGAGRMRRKGQTARRNAGPPRTSLPNCELSLQIVDCGLRILTVGNHYTPYLRGKQVTPPPDGP